MYRYVLSLHTSQYHLAASCVYLSTISILLRCCFIFFFFFNDTATTEIYTISLHDALPICIHYEKDYTLSIDRLLSFSDKETDLFILANPNSPIGDSKTFEEIKPILDTGKMVLIDEAYIEFSDAKSMIKYIDDYPNLLVTRTFSKGFGAAGCRVGMTFGHKDTIEPLSKFRQMYEITGVSMKYCEFLLNNHHLVDTYIQEVVEEKKKVVSMLKHYEVIDSNCNWIHFNNQDDNKKTKEIFDKHKVLVKYCKVHPSGFRDNWCRMTIQPGLSEQEFFKELVNG